MKKILFISLISGIILTQLSGFFCLSNSDVRLSAIFGENIEALAADENFNPGDRLKDVTCECPNGKSGFSLKCRKDGDLEKCTVTQQGSNACYKAKISLNPGIAMLCEGAGVTFGD